MKYAITKRAESKLQWWFTTNESPLSGGGLYIDTHFLSQFGCGDAFTFSDGIVLIHLVRGSAMTTFWVRATVKTKIGLVRLVRKVVQDEASPKEGRL